MGAFGRRPWAALGRAGRAAEGLRNFGANAPRMADQNNWIFRERTLVLGGRLHRLERPVVMAILNATPDSFHLPEDRRVAGDPSAAVDLAGRLLDEGADWLDLGGMSTKPGAAEVPAAEEADRVLPLLEAVHAAFPDVPLSIDTVHAAVAEAAVRAGAVLVNDVSAGRMDPELWPTVARLGVPYVLMHMRGRPEDMQRDPAYGNVAQEVYDFLQDGLAACRAAGMGDVLLDPGFGFGKTLDHNYALLAALGRLRHLGAPVLVGLSRKSMVCRALDVSPAEALNGTSVLHALALLEGADVLRVHDPREAREAIELVGRFRAARAEDRRAEPPRVGLAGPSAEGPTPQRPDA